ncbi:MAG: 3'-5' exonuclease [Acidimicrobiales bacterium]
MTLPAPVGRQVDVLYLSPQGHNVVLGTAGSGKTTMAIHRAVHLGDPAVPGSGRTLLLTFNKALVAYLRHLSPSVMPNVTIEHYHQFARGYLAHRGLIGWNQILNDRAPLLTEAIDQVRRGAGENPVLDRPVTFFADEVQWMAGNGLFQLADYLDAERLGRAVPLQPSQRRLVFLVAETYWTLRAAAHRRYDWDDLAAAVHAELQADTDARRYRHIVIDEGQDFSPEMIRSLVLAADSDGSVTFFGDFAQQIYGQRMSWKSFGLKVRDVFEFKENYRNTLEIARLALAMSEMPHFRDSPDLVEPNNPTAAGPKPALVSCANQQTEIKLVLGQVAKLRLTNTVAVLFRDRADERLISRHLTGATRLHRDIGTWDATPGVFYGTYHAAKGIEFDYVLMPFCSEDRLPDPAVIDAFGLDEALARESRLVYVGVTRARVGLIITHSGPQTSLLPTRAGLYDKSAA